MTKKKPPRREVRRTMASNSFRTQEIDAVLQLLKRAELSPETREISRNPYVQAAKGKFLRMRESLDRRRVAEALAEAPPQKGPVVVPARPSARRGR